MSKDKPLTLVPVENQRSLGRDPHSKAIINTDKEGLRRAREAKLRTEQRIEEEKGRDDRINKVERELADIRGMLTQVLRLLSKD